MIGKRHEYDIMAAVESQHWWYKTLHSQVIQAIRKYSKVQQHLNHPQHIQDTQQIRGSSLINEPQLLIENQQHQLSILDAGCGTGGLLMALKKAGFNHAQGFDLSSDAVAHAQIRGLNVKLGDLNHLSKFASPQSFDIIINNDTLYHLTIDQRIDFFKSCLSLLKPNGIMIMNIPALDAFKGNHDLAVGITERFSKTTLVPFIKSNGFELIQARYWPFVLSPVIWATRVVQKKMRLAVAPSMGYQSDLALPNPLVNKVLGKLCAVEHTVSLPTPWGSSLLLILQKPHHF
jgi:2-polyprenyl-3-methyl-5-hydroxy-6-metoxy-1,4-benzoquinol methylase